MKSQELADAHWEYVGQLLRVGQVNDPPEGLDIIEFHYKTAFMHGYKHGIQDADDRQGYDQGYEKGYAKGLEVGLQQNPPVDIEMIRREGFEAGREL